MGDSFPQTDYHGLLFNEDTIVAVATPPGRGAVGMVRLSGPLAKPILDRVFFRGGKGRKPVSTPRKMIYGWIQDGEEVIDEAEVCYYTPPHTYTGEHLVEFFVHGSPAVLRRLVHLLVSCGARPAEPGEFTLRALRNGRIDLPRAEAVNDLVRAENELTRRLAVRALRGELGEAVGEIRRRLQSMLVSVETELEFESDDTGVDARASVSRELGPCITLVARLVEAGRRQQTHPRGVVTAIVGKPNVGKSSLLNSILRRERAIVSAAPATTRDTIEESVEIHGMPFLLVDTAGVFDAEAEPDTLGVQRSLKAIAQADLVIFLVDLSVDLDARDREIQSRLRQNPPEVGVVSVANKCDLLSPGALSDRLASFQLELPCPDLSPISAKYGTNVDPLLWVLADLVKDHQLLTGADEILVNARQLTGMAQVLSLLQSAQQTYDTRSTLDLIASDLYKALQSLSALQGEGFDGDILTAVFSQFCIGK